MQDALIQLRNLKQAIFLSPRRKGRKEIMYLLLHEKRSFY